MQISASLNQLLFLPAEITTLMSSAMDNNQKSSQISHSGEEKG